MAICINCGQEGESCLCNTCKQTVDIEKLCDKIMKYKPGTGENELWDRIASELYGSYNFKNIIFALTDELPTPRKEYCRILCMAGESAYIAKNSRNWLCETYEICKNTHGLSEMELNRVKGLVMDALYKDYLFARAEEMAAEIMQSEELPKQAYLTLAEFYTKTRRYDEADEILSDAGKIFAGEESMQVSIRNLAEDNAKQREKADSGKQEYMPNPKENRDEVRKNYVEFLASIGIEAEIPVAGTKTRKAPKPIPKDQYPNPVEIREANFDSFVAFDLETTGKSSKIDSIIEFGAIKVVNGQVVDSQEFTFQKFVKPYKRKLSEEVQQLTGITEDDLKDAGEMWEVTPEFMEFVGDNVLVGFNCIAFDSRFMVRAGRYSNIIIENKYFDVLRYTNRFSEQLGIDAKKCSLKELCEKLDVENPRAHTALADAITTAQVYLKLKAMDTGAENVSMDDMLADIEDW